MVLSTQAKQAFKKTSTNALRRRLWRYGPLLLWSMLIFVASSSEMSASNTSRIVRPLLLWLIPSISEEQITLVHFLLRKVAHFTEYGVLALLAARAFLTSSRSMLRQRWFIAAFLLVTCYALLDELNQSFEPSRTGTVTDSLIDMAGGAVALFAVALQRKWPR